MAWMMNIVVCIIACFPWCLALLVVSHKATSEYLYQTPPGLGTILPMGGSYGGEASCFRTYAYWREAGPGQYRLS